MFPFIFDVKEELLTFKVADNLGVLWSWGGGERSGVKSASYKRKNKLRLITIATFKVAKKRVVTS